MAALDERGGESAARFDHHIVKTSPAQFPDDHGEIDIFTQFRGPKDRHCIVRSGDFDVVAGAPGAPPVGAC